MCLHSMTILNTYFYFSQRLEQIAEIVNVEADNSRSKLQTTNILNTNTGLSFSTKIQKK